MMPSYGAKATHATGEAVLGAETACVATNAIGVGHLIRHFFETSGIDEIIEKLNLTRTRASPCSSVCCGHPKAEPGFHRGRLTGEGAMHKGTYHPLDDEAPD